MDDGLRLASYNLSFIRQAMHSYFDISNNTGMLTHLYTTFSKAHIAGFTLQIAAGASQGDLLCREVLADAGEVLGKHVVAVCRKADPTQFPNGLAVVCMGSVWKSWPFLSDSFSRTVKDTAERFGGIRMMSLNDNGTIGAALVGARHSGHFIDVDYTKHVTMFHAL